MEGSQFLNALGFGHHDNVSKSNLDDQWKNDEMEEGSIYSATEENYETASKGSRASLLEQSLEINGELFEQQEAVEDTRLLQCLQELRIHQTRQQEELMRRQQQQLMTIYAENQATQLKIVKQRQATWGKPSNPSTSQPLNGTSSGSPPKLKPAQPSNALPKSVGQSSVGTMLKTNSGSSLSALVNLQSLISLPVKVQKGRPLPVFRETITNVCSNDPDNVSVCTESESNSVESQSEIDGICPLTDVGSDISEIHNGNICLDAAKAMPYVRRNLNFHENGTLSQKDFTDRGLEQVSLGSNQSHCMINPAAEKVNKRVHSPMEMISEKGEEIMSASHDRKKAMLERQLVMTDRNVAGKINFGEDDLSDRTDGRSSSGEEFDGSNSDAEECEEEQTANDTKNRNSCFGEEQKEWERNFDEKPISGLGRRKKTFAELLEEELSKEEQHMDTAQSENHTHTMPKRAFLRKGEGLTKLKKQTSHEPRVHRRSTRVVPAVTRPTKKETTRHGNASSAARKSLAVKESNGPGTKLLLKRLPPGEKGSSGTGKEMAEVLDAKLGLPTPEEEDQKRYAGLEKGKAGVSSSTLKAVSFATAGQAKSSSTSSSFSTGQSSTNARPTAVSSNPCKRTDLELKVVAGTGPTPKSNLGDYSFQQCLQNMTQKEEVELDELEEFEILEQYADDNASFLSNVSAVNRILSNHKDMMKNKPNLTKRVSSTPNPTAEEDENGDETSDGASVMSSREEDSEAEVSSDDDDDEDENDNLDSTLKDETVLHVGLEKAKNSVKQPESRNSQGDEPQIMRRKVALTKRIPETETASSSDDDGDDKLCHTMGGANLEMKKREAGSARLMLAEEGVSSFSKKDGTDSAETFDNRNTFKNDRKVDSRRVENGLRFEDDMSWEESTQRLTTDRKQNQGIRSGSQNNSTSIKGQERIALCLQGDAMNAGGDYGQKLDAVIPPTSKLVSKLFPKLRPDPPIPKFDSQQEQKLESAKLSEIGDGLQSKLLREKLLELENEIQKFRSENASLAKLRKEREEGLEMLKKEMAEFEKQKTDELNRLQEFKAEELRKLRKDKKVFEQYQKSMREQPNKKEREEIEVLKSQLSKLQDEQQKKEQRLTASMSRLRDRVEQLEQEKMELKQENQLLEQRRLEAWVAKKTTDAAVNSAPAFLHMMSELDGDGALALPNVAPRPPSRAKLNVPEPIVKLDGSAEFSYTSSAPKAFATASVTGTTLKDGTKSSLSVLRKDAISEGEAVRPLSRSLGSQSTKTSSSPINFPDNFEKPAEMKSLTRKTASVSAATNVSNSLDRGDNRYEEMKHSDGKVERMFTNGMREILFSNGTRKQVSADGQSIIVSFFNGDIKQILPDQRIVYYYADAQTTHTTYPDGLQILQFPNQQTEKHYPDGTKEISFPDRTIKYVFPSGVEESVFPDGTTIRVEKNGDKVMEFPNGQREIHTQTYKRREYPDGTVKTVYPDGRQETRYSSGRMRVKDKDGNVIVDKQL